ncbi:Glutaredoxin domain-containing cysteine-rich protein 2 [Gavia stellata]|nr:Glutaredoxin domain-containing cysteine-rich protein 2 [Gavia stellata]
MDEQQKKLNQRHEGRPRKVRFKISSAYSGRVLKQVYEDGQELEPPAKEHSRRFLRHGFEPGDRFCGAGETLENSALGGGGELACAAELAGQRGCSSGSPGIIVVCRVYLYRRDTDKILLQASPILDFGKIIIYTNNLKIIRAPMDQKELMRRVIQAEGINDWAFIYRERKERFGGGHKKDVGKKVACNQYVQEGDAEHGCSQCKGSGSAPCSLCHGSKFSMLANRFRESYRALRCPACNESGLQPCQICAA